MPLPLPALECAMTDGLPPFGLFLISLFGQGDVSFDSTSEAMSVFGKVLKLFSFNSASIMEQNDLMFINRMKLYFHEIFLNGILLKDFRGE